MCKVNHDTATNFFSSNIGIRQGDNVCPNMFKLFIYEFQNIFDDDCQLKKLNTTDLNCLLCADDVLLLSEIATWLQTC